MRHLFALDNVKHGQLGPVLLGKRQSVGQGSPGSGREVSSIEDVTESIQRQRSNLRSDGKHWTSRVSNYLLRGGPHDGHVDFSTLMCTDDNQIDGLIRHDL